jgi:hypothetical protein
VNTNELTVEGTPWKVFLQVDSGRTWTLGKAV